MKPTIREVCEVVDAAYSDGSGWGTVVWVCAEGYRLKVPAHVADKVQNRLEYNFPDADVRVSDAPA